MITIRRLDAADAKNFKDQRLLATKTSPTAIWPTYEEEARMPIDEVAARIAPTETLTVFGAFSSGDLVGIAGVRRELLLKVCHNALIWGVFVNPRHRRKGIAQDLLKAATDHASRQWRAVQLMRCVNAQNVPAKALYVSQGFAPFGIEPRAMFVEGRYYDEEHMYKVLQ